MPRPTLYGQHKRQISLTLTPQAIEKLKEMSQSMGLNSISELIEQFSRGEIPASQADLDQLRMGKPLAI